MRRRGDVAAILALSLAMMLYWLGTTHPQFNEDSVQYLAGARKLAGQPHENFVIPYRPPGYSLFLVLTGVPWLESFRWLVAVQALLGLAMPPLIYRTLQPLGRAPALGASLAAALVPIPYIYAGMVMTEQLNLFLQLLFVYLAARYLSGERPPQYLYLATLTAFALVLTRPMNALVFWLFLPVAVLAPPRRIREPLRAALLYCALLVAWSGVDWLGLGYGNELSPGEGAATHRAALRFEEAYFHTWAKNFEDYGELRPLIVPENGPASRSLYACLAEALREKPASWVFRQPLVWFGAYHDNPDALLREFFVRPNSNYLRFIQETVNRDLGPEAAGGLFAGVARECGMGGWPGLVAHLSAGVSSRLGGTSLFWEASTAARHHGAYDSSRPFPLIRPENGPATRQIYEALAVFERASGGTVGASAAGIAADPGYDSFRPMSTAALRLYGPDAADRLLRDVALEAFRAYPAAALLFWDNFVMLAAGPNAVYYGTAKRDTALAGVLYMSSGLDHLPEKLRREVSGARPGTTFFDALYRGAHLLKPFILVACLILLPFGWAGPARPLLCLLLLLAASQYAIVSVMSQPHGRYADSVYLLLVMALAIGAAGVRSEPWREKAG